jgi:hypothetical protein
MNPPPPLICSRLWFALALLGLAACDRSNEFVVSQRSSAPIPGFDGRVRVYVSDIERGRRAEKIRISGPDNAELASGLRVTDGDELEFQFEGKTYTLEVSWYEDHTFGTDKAHLRIMGLSKEQLARAKNPVPPPPAPAPPAPAPEPVAQSISPPAPPPPSTSPEQGMAVAPAPLEEGGDACGTRQPTIQERIADCAKKSSSVASLGPGDAGTSTWQLVTRTASGRHVWLQVRTGKLWSDRLGRERVDMTSWCRAKGEVGASARVDCTPAPSPAAGAPSFAYAQLQPPESWCAEQADFATPTRFDESKGGMRLTATAHSPSVTWALPTEEEWNAAKADGAEGVLPDGKDPFFWPASLVKRGMMSLLTKAVEARAGLTPEQAAQAGSMGTVLAVRCVGTPRP